MTLLAHVKQDDNKNWIIHDLKKHLEGVAVIAEKCAEPLGLEKIARLTGLTHDFGKASKAFQNKIASQSGYDPEVHADPNVDHSTAGAQYLSKEYGLIGNILAYTVSGHHGGLPNGQDETESCLKKRLSKAIEEYQSTLPMLELPVISPQDIIPAKHSDKQPPQIPFLTRMLYSCLVDGDFLDTESFMSPDQTTVRKSNKSNIKELREMLNNFVSGFKANTPINKKRADILQWCRDAAQNETGLFSLTVPTGGGKTVSSMAFALDHAVRNNLRRVIYVIPYTSIITQNADVFRDIFGDENVLEHHSNLDPENETALNRLSSQNWDAPIVVTTNVQFFESFYSNRSSSCRKLHNVGDSVIIFDEAQMFPTEYLKPSVSIIRELVRSYGCSAVLCTATQPTLSDSALLKKEALENVREIMPDPETLYNDFKRVKVSLIDEQLSHESIAKRMAELDQILTIVNTRKEARQIMESLEDMTSDVESIYHLSTMMCPEHRKEILQTVRDRLRDGIPCRVVSTQLIEAGVDVDFPVVYRAIAGIDSIAQAAGRCNRNGLRDVGEVFVFKGETPPPPGHLRLAAQSGERVLNGNDSDPLSLEAISSYFQDFYWKQSNGHNLDKKDIMGMTNVKPQDFDKIPFKDIANAFSIIEEDTRSIIVPYDVEGTTLIEQLRKWADCLQFNKTDEMFLPRDMQKCAQRFSVQLRKKPFEELASTGVLEDLFGDGQYLILTNNDIYKEGVGLVTDKPAYMESESLIL